MFQIPELHHGRCEGYHQGCFPSAKVMNDLLAPERCEMLVLEEDLGVKIWELERCDHWCWLRMRGSGVWDVFMC